MVSKNFNLRLNSFLWSLFSTNLVQATKLWLPINLVRSHEQSSAISSSQQRELTKLWLAAWVLVTTWKSSFQWNLHIFTAGHTHTKKPTPPNVIPDKMNATNKVVCGSPTLLQAKEHFSCKEMHVWKRSIYFSGYHHLSSSQGLGYILLCYFSFVAQHANQKETSEGNRSFYHAMSVSTQQTVMYHIYFLVAIIHACSTLANETHFTSIFSRLDWWFKQCYDKV